MPIVCIHAFKLINIWPSYLEMKLYTHAMAYTWTSDELIATIK